MALKSHLLSTGLALATLERLDDLINCYIMSNNPYMPNFVCHPQEAPVVHQPDPGVH